MARQFLALAFVLAALAPEAFVSAQQTTQSSGAHAASHDDGLKRLACDDELEFQASDGIRECAPFGRAELSQSASQQCTAVVQQRLRKWRKRGAISRDVKAETAAA